MKLNAAKLEENNKILHESLNNKIDNIDNKVINIDDKVIKIDDKVTKIELFTTCEKINLKSAGFNALQVRDTVPSFESLKLIGYTTLELKEAGYSAKEVKDGGYSAQEVKDGGYSIKEIHDGGYSAKEVKDVGYSIKEIHDGGYSAQEVKDVGYSAQEVKDGGYSIKEIYDCGYYLHEWCTSLNTFSGVSFSCNNKVVTKTEIDGWKNASCISNDPVKRFKVQIFGKNIMVGLIYLDNYVIKSCNFASGYSLYMLTGGTYINGAEKAYTSPIANKDIIEILHDTDNNTITFCVNGVSKGIAFSGVLSPLHAFCDLSEVNSQIKLLD
jgi:hypothetical protein